MESPRVEDAPEPTDLDRENARARQAIAAKQEAEWVHCLKLAWSVLGPDWKPWMKLTLLESDYHRKRDQPPVVGAVAFKVYRGELRLTESSRYVIQDADGTVRHAARYEDLFGALLTEKHPTYGFEKAGQWLAFDRWSVTWAPLELYSPMSPEKLAALRVSRERGKVEREAKKWAEEHPLLAWLERQEKEGAL